MKLKYQIRKIREYNHPALYRYKKGLFVGQWEYLKLAETLAELIEYAAEDARTYGKEYEVLWSSEILAGQSK
jgi:uncharacterized protein YdiU (UPF0061 family)